MGFPAVPPLSPSYQSDNRFAVPALTAPYLFTAGVAENVAIRAVVAREPVSMAVLFEVAPRCQGLHDFPFCRESIVLSNSNKSQNVHFMPRFYP